MVPVLLIAMGVDPEAYRESKGHIIADQGKPPAWGSPSTGGSTRPGSSMGPAWRETG